MQLPEFMNEPEFAPQGPDNELLHADLDRPDNREFLVPVGDYAAIVVEEVFGGTAEVSILNKETGVKGRGNGDVRTLMSAWKKALKKARRWGMTQLYCSPTTGDGRGETRRRVFLRAGFCEEPCTRTLHYSL